MSAAVSDELLLEPVREHLRAHGPPGLARRIRVERAELGDDAGLAGAAAWERATSSAEDREGAGE